jgi:fumarate reductase flavoprotein subunit
MLVATINEYNEYCKQNYDPIFGKGRTRLNVLEGRLCGGVINQGAYGTLGGIRINSKLQVVTDEYKPIPGLYGAGNDVCDIYAGTYIYKLAGNTMGFALNSGRLAAEHALEYLDELGGNGE